MYLTHYWKFICFTSHTHAWVSPSSRWHGKIYWWHIRVRKSANIHPSCKSCSCNPVLLTMMPKEADCCQQLTSNSSKHSIWPAHLHLHLTDIHEICGWPKKTGRNSKTHSKQHPQMHIGTGSYTHLYLLTTALAFVNLV